MLSDYDITICGTRLNRQYQKGIMDLAPTTIARQYLAWLWHAFGFFLSSTEKDDVAGLSGGLAMLYQGLPGAQAICSMEAVANDAHSLPEVAQGCSVCLSGAISQDLLVVNFQAEPFRGAMLLTDVQ